MHDRAISGDSRRPRLAAIALFLVCLFVYAWFFQGDGYNQFSHFDTTRAVVERASFEITEYAANTGDVSVVGRRVYSNKPPGLALFAAPAYFVVERVQRARGADFDDERVFRTNLYFVTIWAAALPGAILSVAVFWYFRRSGSEPTEALILAGAFAFGTLVMPYAGVMMNHNLVAMCLFVAWLLVTSPKQTPWRNATAGALLGLGVMTEYLVGPLVLLFVPMVWRRERWSSVLAFAIGPIFAVAALTAFHVINFGSPASSTYTVQQNEFRQEGLFLGVFGWPDVRRLYWLTFHSFRGLFYACPVLMLTLFALAAPLRRVKELFRSNWLPLAVAAYYLLFNLTFNGWTGGWSVGPRYLIPAIPFLYVFARDGFRRFPFVAAPLIVISVCNMVAIASVRLMFPANNFGPPPASEVDRNPIVECYRLLTWNKVARNDGSFNVGQSIGLDGVASIAPPLIAIVTFFAICIFAASQRGSNRVLGPG